jgi:hypothetical protein
MSSRFSKKVAGFFRKAQDNIGSLRRLDDIGETIAKTLNRTSDLLAKNDAATQLFKEGTANAARKTRLRQLGFQDDQFEYLDNISNDLRLDVDAKQNHLIELKNADPATPDNELFAATKDLENAQKELDSITNMSNKLDSLAEYDQFKDIQETIKAAKEKSKKAVDNSSGFCKGDSLKYCAGAGVVGGYYTVNSWNQLKDDKKKCLSMCYPDDYKENPSNPTYKTQDAVSPSDPSIEYSFLYPEHADQLCTPENMLKEGAENCDEFCKNTCDYDFKDVIDGIFHEVGEDTGGLFGSVGEFFKGLFGGNMLWILLLLCVPVLFLLLFVMIKK